VVEWQGGRVAEWQNDIVTEWQSGRVAVCGSVWQCVAVW
jgi:hypothetical protein